MRGKTQFEPTVPRLGALLAGAATFVLITSGNLPPLVASHFGVGGAVDGFMSRNAYVGYMLVGVVVIPLLIVVPQRLVRSIPPRLINVPNRDYWLAPERIESTLDYLRNHAVWFAALLVAFLCFVHWEVVQANMRRPVRLLAEPFIVGVVAYTIGILVWIGAMIVHFSRRPDASAERR